MINPFKSFQAYLSRRRREKYIKKHVKYFILIAAAIMSVVFVYYLEMKKSSSAPPQTPNAVSESTSGQIVYLGVSKNINLANGLAGQTGFQSFIRPDEIIENKLYLEGDWDIQDDYAENKSAYARILYGYKTKNIFMNLSADPKVLIKILRDGQDIGDAAGEDADARSYMWVDENRLYKIVSEDNAEEFHTLELIIGEPGLRAFTLSFD